MTKAVLVGSIFLSSLIIGLIFYDYKRISSKNYKSNLKKKQLKKKEQAISENLSKKDQFNSSEKNISNEQYTIDQSVQGQKCLDTGDVAGFIEAYTNIVLAQNDPIKCLEELSEYLPENIIMAITHKAFQHNFFNHFPEKYGIKVVVDNTSGKRIVVADRDFNVDEVLFILKPLSSYILSDYNLYDYCFICKKYIQDHKTSFSCNKMCGFLFCSLECFKLLKEHDMFCVAHTFSNCVEKSNKVSNSDCIQDTNCEDIENKENLSSSNCNLKFNQENPKSIAETKEEASLHPFIQLQKLSKESGRTIYFAIVQLYRMMECENISSDFRDGFSQLYIPFPSPGPSLLTTKEHELVTKFINPKNKEIQVYVALVCKVIYNELKFQSNPNPRNEGYLVSGKGIYPEASFFDHSCVPNVQYYSASGTSELTFSILSPIKKGDALTIDYINDPAISGEDRKKYLYTVYDFYCKCEKCVN